VTPYEQWRARELHILRQIARLAGAILLEETDPAMDGSKVLLQEALTDLHQWRLEGRAHGWGS